MSTDPLVTLTVNNLRGATTEFTLPFNPTKKLTVIYGENASGKSTIADALELIGKGKVGSLENRGLGQTRRFWPSIGKTRGDIDVVLASRSKRHKVQVTANDVVVIPAEDRPRVEVLRRAQVLALILARETDRFDAIDEFIDVGGVESAEEQLKAALTSAKSSHETVLTRLGENQATIEAFWTQAGQPEGDPMTWARAQVAASDREKDTVAIERLGRLVESFDLLEQRVSEAAEARSELESQRMKLEQAALARGQAEQGSDVDAPTLRLLEAAEQLLGQSASPSACPLCGSAEKTATLAGMISQRLAALRELREAAASEAEASLAFAAAERSANSRETAAMTAARLFDSAFTDQGLPEGTVVPSDPFPSHAPQSWESWVKAVKPDRQQWSAELATVRDLDQFIGALSAAITQYDSNATDQQELATVISALERAHAIVVEERKAFVDTVLIEIATEVGRLYELVHPEEGLDKISLQLNPKQRRALQMAADFGAHPDQPPQAYFSDSHLDTLGLCIFLALAKREGADETILVLDDILGSVDEPHVDRLIEMLYGEAIAFRHCVLTTHYGPWKHKLRWGWLKNGQCEFIELAPWSAAGGLSLTKTLPDVERLKLLLNESPPDRQLICAKAAVILEAALDFLTLLYECPVPRKQEDRYTLGDLLPNIKKKLRESLKVEVGGPGTTGGNVVPLGPILDRLHQISEARNLFGCHFKAISFDMLDTEAMEFGTLVVELMDALTDTEAGWPKSDKSGSYWATSGETRKLHPLRRPD